MGAHDFTNFVAGDMAVGDAYTMAVELAHYEHGHDPYNGTISTTQGCFVVGRAAMPLDLARALVASYWQWEQEGYDLEDEDELSVASQREYEDRNPIKPHMIEKWGAAAAIAVSEPQKGWLFFGLAAS